jgi:hypothetical protein
LTGTSAQNAKELPLVFVLASKFQDPNVQVSYRLAGQDMPTQLYPQLPADAAAHPNAPTVTIQPDDSMLLVEFKWCAEKPCGISPKGPDNLPNQYPNFGCPPHKNVNGVEIFKPCTTDVVFVRDLYDLPAVGTPTLKPAFILTKDSLEVSEELIKKSRKANFPTFVINGITLNEYFGPENSEGYFPRTDAVGGNGTDEYLVRGGWATVKDFSFIRYPVAESCRPYAQEEVKDDKREIDVRRPGYAPVKLDADNGVTIHSAKVYDVFTLRQMLAGTAAQLAAISGFNQASIWGAIGNLQGVTTDISYLTAQATTVPTAVVTSQAVNGMTGNNTMANTTGQNAAVNNTNSTITCPAGTLPGIGTAGLPACTAVTSTNTQSASNSVSAQTSNGSSASSNSTGSTLTTSGAGNVNGGSSLLLGATANSGTNSNNSNTTVQGTNQQNTTTTTSGGQAGTISAVPVSNAPSAPTNIGVSAQDILTQQVQLNSQITTLRMALQGALSDQYLVNQGKAAGTRQQTTLGINVEVSPLERYRHAVAEVRVWVYPTVEGKTVSIVNLLPEAKTYNVAKVTSNQKAFGAGVVIDPVNVGAAGGKTKNRLYLAKDTDTVALEYFADSKGKKADSWPNGATPIGRSAQEHLHDLAREAEIWQTLTDACAEDPGPGLDPDTLEATMPENPIVFGWQFRPVLGADYVQSGNRAVFAQLALPGAYGQLSSPRVFIQTRWREYDSKRQVVGAVYKGSCSIQEDTDPIVISSPLKVHRAYFDDMGGGILKVRAEGQFFAQGFSAMSGPNTISPTTFDGKTVQFFASAASLLLSDDLKLVTENGVTTPIGLRPVPDDPNDCDVQLATFTAVPRPDGNSWVEAAVAPGPSWKLGVDGTPHPLIMIGSQVYGLHETPFLEPTERACVQPDSMGGITCTYHFLASTSVLRAAQNYMLRDLAWTNFKTNGKIEFDPSFGGLTALTGSSGAGGSDGTSDGTAAGGKAASIYALSGSDLLKISALGKLNCVDRGCLEVFQGLSKFTLDGDNFQVSSQTTAVMAFGPQTPMPVISLRPANSSIGIAAGTDPAAAKAAAPAPLMPPVGKAAPPATCPATCEPKKAKATAPDPTRFFYTTDGSTPSEGPGTALYSASPTISTTGIHPRTNFVVKAIAVAPNQLPSQVAVGKFYKAPDSTIMPIYSLNAPQTNYKSFRFIWHSTVGYPVEWDLSVPSAAAASAVTANTILNAGDSTEVDFSGVNVLTDSPSTPITFTFDDQLVVNPLFSYDATKKTLKFMVTTPMTAKPGHKIIVMNGYLPSTDASNTNKTTQVLLPFDVTRR